MSVLSSYVKRQVRKHGAKAFFLKIAKMIAKATPSKKDDKVVAEIEKALNELE